MYVDRSYKYNPCNHKITLTVKEAALVPDPDPLARNGGIL